MFNFIYVIGRATLEQGFFYVSTEFESIKLGTSIGVFNLITLPKGPFINDVTQVGGRG